MLLIQKVGSSPRRRPIRTTAAVAARPPSVVPMTNAPSSRGQASVLEFWGSQGSELAKTMYYTTVLTMKPMPTAPSALVIAVLMRRRRSMRHGNRAADALHCQFAVAIRHGHRTLRASRPGTECSWPVRGPIGRVGVSGRVTGPAGA